MRRMVRLICAFAVCVGALSAPSLRLLRPDDAHAARQARHAAGSVFITPKQAASNRSLKSSRMKRSAAAEDLDQAAPADRFAGALKPSSWLEPLRKNHGSSAMRAPPSLPA